LRQEKNALFQEKVNGITRNVASESQSIQQKKEDSLLGESMELED